MDSLGLMDTPDHAKHLRRGRALLWARAVSTRIEGRRSPASTRDAKILASAGRDSDGGMDRLYGSGAGIVVETKHGKLPVAGGIVGQSSFGAFQSGENVNAALL